ncbi:MAG: LysM peptidoglycan-binding domain-containing protein [Actinomycetota bacterium]
MARARVRWGRLGRALVVGAILGGAFAGVARGSPDAGRTYTVQPGDTVWSIARRLVGATGDPRPAVDDLIRRNRLVNALVRPGQLIVLPD